MNKKVEELRKENEQLENIIQAQKKTILNRNDELDHLQDVIDEQDSRIKTQAEVILERDRRIEELKCNCRELTHMTKQKQTNIEILQKCNETRMKELEELKEQFEELRHTLRESEEYERRLLYTIEELKERLYEGEQKVDYVQELEYVQEPDIERETRTTEYEPDYIMVDAVYPNGTDIRFHIPINAYKDE